MRRRKKKRLKGHAIDHVLVEGMTMREARQRAQPKSRFMVASIRTFREDNI